MSTLWQDLFYGGRRLVRSPGFTLAAVLTLALGIGANTAIFQLVEAVQLRSVPVRDPESLVEIRIADMSKARGSFGWHAALTNAIWEELRRRQDAVAGAFAWGSGRLSLESTGEPRFASAILASGGFFETLGVQPAVGRLLGERDDQKGCAAAAVVLSHAFWQREYGGDPSVVGRQVNLGRYPFEIVGVTAAGFTGLEVGRSFDVAVPLCAEALPPGKESRLDSGTSWWLVVMGRLEPGESRERASAELAAISPGVFEATLPPNYPRESVASYLGFELEAQPASGGISLLREQYSASLLFLQATAGLVLLVGCANLASLMLARATARERELAARVALGAGRGRLVRLLLSESLLLAALGAVTGAWLAGGLSSVLVSAIDTRPSSLFLDLGLDWRVFGFAAAARHPDLRALRARAGAPRGARLARGRAAQCRPRHHRGPGPARPAASARDRPGGSLSGPRGGRLRVRAQPRQPSPAGHGDGRERSGDRLRGHEPARDAGRAPGERPRRALRPAARGPGRRCRWPRRPSCRSGARHGATPSGATEAMRPREPTRTSRARAPTTSLPWGWRSWPAARSTSGTRPRRRTWRS